MKDIFDKELKSKLEAKNRKIYNYIYNNNLDMEAIINDYTNYIYAIISNCFYNMSDEDKEEIVLDVFLTVWKNKDKLNINNNISSYIGGITKNLIKLKFRKLKLMENIEDYDDKFIDLPNIEFYVSNNEKYKIILDALNKFKQEDKEIFIEYYNYEKSIKELTILFNMSESKIKSKLFRIRKKLKKILKERGYDSNE